jgi:hypothetical protein
LLVCLFFEALPSLERLALPFARFASHTLGDFFEGLLDQVRPAVSGELLHPVDGEVFDLTGQAGVPQRDVGVRLGVLVLELVGDECDVFFHHFPSVQQDEEGLGACYG